MGTLNREPEECSRNALGIILYQAGSLHPVVPIILLGFPVRGPSFTPFEQKKQP